MSEHISRDRDRRIVELLGWTDIQVWEAYPGVRSIVGISPISEKLYGRHHEPVPHYSTDAKAALYLVLKLKLHVGPFDEGWYASDRNDWNEEDAMVETAPGLAEAVSMLAARILERDRKMIE